jgi:hypothetical protein
MALPVSILAPLADFEAWLGAAAQVSGALWVEQRPIGWDAEFTGRLHDVDLQTLVGDHFPHQLTGNSDVEVAKAIFRNGRLTEAEGQFLAGPGTIGLELVKAAAEAFDCEPGSLDWKRPRVVRYRELAFSFQIDASGMLLAGRCRSLRSSAAVLVAPGDAVFLFSPRAGSISPVINLVRMLVPQSHVRVPATLETSGLLPFLPIPPMVPPRSDDVERTPQARARLRTEPE